MDRLSLITALAANAADRAGSAYAKGLIDGIDLMLDRLREDGVPTGQWANEVRDFTALAKEHTV